MTDQRLLERYRAERTPELFAELVGRHAGVVYGTALRITGNAHDAEDVSQECFLQLARDEKSAPRLLSAWLHRMAVNRSLNLIRAKGRRRTHERAAVEQRMATEKEAAWDDVAPLVDEALDRLPEELREPLILHFLHEQTQEQIGARLNVDRSTVSRRMQKGISTLRSSLQRAGVAVSAAALMLMLKQGMAQAAPTTLTTTLAGIAAKSAAPKTASGAVAGWMTGKLAVYAATGALLLGGSGILAVALARGGDTAEQPPAHVAVEKDPPAEETPDTVPITGTPVLTNDRILFPKDDVAWLDMNKVPWCLQARLSTDGSRLLYCPPAPVGEPETEEAYNVILRDIATGDDQWLPVPPNGFNRGLPRINCFDPTGMGVLMLLPAAEGAQRPYEIAAYDLRYPERQPRLLGGPLSACFDRTGEHVIAFTVASRGAAELQFRNLVDGTVQRVGIEWEGLRYIHSVCPTEDIACFFGVEATLREEPREIRHPETGAVMHTIPGPRRSITGLRLYNVHTGEFVARLPVHEKNSQLDDIMSVWTPDGRYIAWLDYEGEKMSNDTWGCRVWDRVEGQVHAFLPNGCPVGPGPTPSSLWLIRTDKADPRPVLYDAAGGRSWVLGKPGMRLLHATGNRIVTLHTTPDGVRTIHVADLDFGGPEEEAEQQ